MKKLIGMCGLDCSKCGAYIATVKDSDKLRKQTAEEWAKEYNSPDLTPDQINCMGCISDGPHFSHCFVCDIRKCGLKHKVKNCGECREFACGRIKKFHKDVPEARKNCVKKK